MPSIREWPASTRPRERLIARGAPSASDDELLAVLIGSGVRGRSALALARDVLVAVGGMRGLAHAEHKNGRSWTRRSLFLAVEVAGYRWRAIRSTRRAQPALRRHCHL